MFDCTWLLIPIAIIQKQPTPFINLGTTHNDVDCLFTFNLVLLLFFAAVFEFLFFFLSLCFDCFCLRFVLGPVLYNIVIIAVYIDFFIFIKTCVRLSVYRWCITIIQQHNPILHLFLSFLVAMSHSSGSCVIGFGRFDRWRIINSFFKYFLGPVTSGIRNSVDPFWFNF